MKQVSLALVALLTAVVAAVLSATAFLGQSEPLATPQVVGPESAVDTTRLERRISELDAKVAALTDEFELLRIDRESAGSPREAVSDEVDLAAVAARVAALERDLAADPGNSDAGDSDEMEWKSPDGDYQGALTESERANLQRMIDDWTSLARDPLASEAERLDALSGLRGNHQADGTDARLAVLPEMILLAQTTQDAATRADVWRQLSHVTDRSLLAPLLDSLQNDASDEVREEAAETLADFLPDPAAKSALEYAAQYDPDEGVRRQAADSLGG